MLSSLRKLGNWLMIGRNDKGQATVEYVLLLGLTMGMYLGFARVLSATGLAEKLAKPINENFARAYQHGHPKAQGFDDGGPKKHPRAETGEGSFRIFLNSGFNDR